MIRGRPMSKYFLKKSGSKTFLEKYFDIDLVLIIVQIQLGTIRGGRTCRRAFSIICCDFREYYYYLFKVIELEGDWSKNRNENLSQKILTSVSI